MGPSETFAVLHQAGPAPPVDGICKPMKPGGYRDSSADIAFALRQRGLRVLTPVDAPDAAGNDGWSFPDTREGVLEAIERGATVLWANTVLFRQHPIEEALRRGLSVVGQLPELVDRYDDKSLTNRLLAEHGLPVPSCVLVALRSGERALAVDQVTEAALAERGIRLPAVVKPIRGRGSEGVCKVDTLAALRAAVVELIEQTERHEGITLSRYGSAVMVEEYLSGEECTVSVLPPGSYRLDGRECLMSQPWALPPVRRFGHRDGIAPYSGVVAVTRNSELLSKEQASDPRMRELLRHCCRAAELVGARAVIRIDCRADHVGRWRLFDVNLKPNMTGSGRPGREDQDSLVSIAARGVGWDYGDLIENLARQQWQR